MGLNFLFRRAATPARVAIFPGAWNPPTIAHLEIARAALKVTDEVVWVLPRRFPHKDFENVSLEDRAGMLERIARAEEGFSAAISEGGIYAAIAEEAREFFGRDAAERIANWDYGASGVLEAMLDRHRLLVAARSGDYRPPKRHRKRIVQLPLELPLDEVSSSEIRRRIAAGLGWRKLVPPSIVDLVEELYT